MKKAHKKFQQVFIGFIISIVIMFGLVVAPFYLPIDSNYQMLLASIILIIMLVFVAKSKPRLRYYLEQYMFFRLKDNQGPLIVSDISPEQQNFYQSLISDDFTAYSRAKDFTVLYKYVKDRKQVALRRPMLVVFVIIHQDDITFQDKNIVKEINRLEDELYKNKKRIINYTVLMAKTGLELSPKIKEACDYITISRMGKRSVVNINAYYATSTKSHYFLYSDSYMPSVYYSYAVELLKKHIS